MISTGRLNLGSNMGFDRNSCHQCSRETLHHHGACVHCGRKNISTLTNDKISLRKAEDRSAAMRKARTASS